MNLGSQMERGNALVVLANDVGVIAEKELNVFSPILCDWYPESSIVAAKLLHQLYGERLVGIPVIFSFIISFTCQMFLQAQSKNIIISYLAAFSLAIHVFLSWLLTVKYKFGLSGAMVSTILAFWIPNIGQLVYIFGGWCSETWKGFSMLAFKDLLPIIKLSLSYGVMLCLGIMASGRGAVSGRLLIVVNSASDFGWSLLKSSFLQDDRTPIRSGVDGVEFLTINLITMSFSLDQIKEIKVYLGVDDISRI